MILCVSCVKLGQTSAGSAYTCTIYMYCSVGEGEVVQEKRAWQGQGP